MRTLKISKGGLSLTEHPLTSPVVIIGRSPACDIVLRAFGVAPVHFLLEWVGVGVFEESEGRWILFDISHHEDTEEVSVMAGKEGVVISKSGVDFGGFYFKIEDDSLAMTDLSGGMIHERVTELVQGTGRSLRKNDVRLLEVIKVNPHEKTVTDVSHHLVTGKGDGTIPAVPNLKIKWVMGEMSKIVWDKAQAVKIYSRGALVHSRLSKDDKLHEVDFKDQDFLRFDLQDQEVYMRYVEAIQIKPAEHDFFKNPAVRAGLAAVLIMIAIMYFVLTTPAFVKVPEVKGPPRIAKVEVIELRAAPPAPVPIPDPNLEKKDQILKKSTESATAETNVKKAVESPKKKSGLNSPAPPANVNSVGLLGALKKSGGRGNTNRVSADMILNNGVVSKTVSGDDGQIIVSQPPAGAVDLSARVTKRGAKGSELGSASTTLKAGDSYDMKSASPIAGSGGQNHFSVGTGTGSDRSVLGEQKSGVADLGGKEGFSAQGGLDKEAVRLTLMKYRRQIRTCYEKALLMNPRVGGRIVYQWYISAKGPVTSVVLKSSEAGMPTLENCVETVIKSAIFPAAPNGQPTIVIYPFVFQKT